MLEKTRGIVLNQIKYTDSGIVARLYTRRFGRQAFLIKGMRNKKAGKHSILFQPMFILDLELNYKAVREMQVLKEFSVSFAPYSIYSNIVKSSIAIFLAEVLASVIKEEGPNEEMFDYIEESIRYFDGCIEGYTNFHISFLAGLSSYLGFEPGSKKDESEAFFDMANGLFVPIPPVHGNYANKEVSAVLAAFFEASFDTASRIPLTGTLRNELLETLVKYYSLHLPGLKKINSLEILKEVFS
jgi:DNA repair protein RecO (recombination protein O)